MIGGRGGERRKEFDRRVYIRRRHINIAGGPYTSHTRCARCYLLMFSCTLVCYGRPVVATSEGVEAGGGREGGGNGEKGSLSADHLMLVLLLLITSKAPEKTIRRKSNSEIVPGEFVCGYNENLQ